MKVNYYRDPETHITTFWWTKKKEATGEAAGVLVRIFPQVLGLVEGFSAEDGAFVTDVTFVVDGNLRRETIPVGLEHLLFALSLIPRASLLCGTAGD